MDEAPKILIVDDDESFRSLVVRLLTNRGYEVVEARSTRDANALLNKNVFSLLIVDYKLPDLDGMSWIQQLRERNIKVPIAFCSGIWCDQTTFNWLRNILRVDLVLNKPIEPQLFIEVIESLLPRPKKAAVQEDTASLSSNDSSILQAEYEQILHKFPGSQLARAELENIINSPDTEAEMLEKLKGLRRKLDVEELINVAKVKYLGELGQIWPALTREIKAYKDDYKNRSAYEKGVGLAHKLRGTAGSFHIDKVAHAAGKLEDMLQSLDPTDELSAEVIWSEIFRHLSAGEVGIREEREALGSFTISENIIPLIRLLMIGESKALERLATSPEVTGVCDVVSVATLDKALSVVRNASFAAIIVGPPVSKHAELLKFTQEIRVSEDNQQVPLILLADATGTISDNQLKYAGFSEAFSEDVTAEELVSTVQLLASEKDKLKSRVLLVDDDEVLTSFVSRVLRGNGYLVEALNEPILIMEKLNRFDPHLVILDVIMPGLTGYDVCRLIRGDVRWQDLTVLFLTAKSNQDGRANAFKAGGDDLLGKPVLTEELLARVSTYLQIGKLKRIQAEIDAGTNLLNRNTFLRQAEKIFSASPEGFVLCLFAIDKFDKIGEQYGVFACETVLSTMGRLIRTRFQPTVVKGRWGEKGFALAFANESVESVGTFMELLRQEFGAIKFAGQKGESFSVSFSTGLTAYPVDGEMFEQLRDRAIQVLLDNIHQRLSPAK